jgi:Ulp1 family protease
MDLVRSIFNWGFELLGLNVEFEPPDNFQHLASDDEESLKSSRNLKRYRDDEPALDKRKRETKPSSVILSEEFIEDTLLGLSEEEEIRLRTVLDDNLHLDEIIVEGFNRNLYRKQLFSLRPRGWLNDEVINFELDILQERIKQTKLPIHVWETFFFTKLSEGDVYRYDLVERWTNGVDILKKEKILVPIHRNKCHWALAIINIEKEEFRYLDSLKYYSIAEADSAITFLANWLYHESLKRNSSYRNDPRGWRRFLDTACPKQSNGFDCGVFVLLFAWTYGLDNAPPDGIEPDRIRQKIAKDIVTYRPPPA